MNNAIKTREKLVATAFVLFHKQGFSSTGVAQILRSADVNSGSLYHFFPTKEDLLIAVLEWCKANLWPEVIQPVFDRVSDPIERVFGVLDGYRQMLIITDCSQGCPIGNLALELADTHPINLRRAAGGRQDVRRVTLRGQPLGNRIGLASHVERRNLHRKA